MHPIRWALPLSDRWLSCLTVCAIGAHGLQQGGSMRVARPLISVFIFLGLVPSLFAQGTTPSANTQPLNLLQSSYSALMAGVPLQDITLTGNIQWTAGATNESGTVNYQALASAYRLDMTFREGTRSESALLGNVLPTGNWVGFDGTVHPIANHNLLNDVGFFPALTLSKLIGSSSSSFTYVGLETRNGSSVIHISVLQQPPSQSSGVTALALQHLSQVEVYLDPATLLPVSYLFNSHPDGDSSRDIPTEIDYSNFQQVNGIVVPLHVQKLFNNVLAYDFQFQSARLNTNLSISQVSAQ
jgi:hypothetical protein